MMTAKYVDPDGPERVFAVKETEFVQPAYGYCCPATQLGLAPSKGRVRFIYPDGSDYHVYGGTVYVMNENGKTVAKYDLGGERTCGGSLSSSGQFTAVTMSDASADASAGSVNASYAKERR